MTLFQTLSQKPLYSEHIDTTRMPRAYEAIKHALSIPPIVHVVGTNGKGSTGRFLALMLVQQGKSVGHYTSPHLLRFNERLWKDGVLVEDETLEALHVKLSSLLPSALAQELSYFEYTTFLAILAFATCDVIVLEAGLGGEWDATNVFPKVLSVITPIGMDHQSFLGETLEEIAGTKLRSIETATLIASSQEPLAKEVAKTIANAKEVPLVEAHTLVCAKTKSAIDAYIQHHALAPFFSQNLQTAYAAARMLGYRPDIATLLPLDLRARCERVAPNVLLDCGHNPMAARALVQTLGEKKYTFIYNSYADKDVIAILEILRPCVKEMHLMPLPQMGRKTAQVTIEETMAHFGIPLRPFTGELDPAQEYVVFGSFAVAEQFLEGRFAQ